MRKKFKFRKEDGWFNIDLGDSCAGFCSEPVHELFELPSATRRIEVALDTKKPKDGNFVTLVQMLNGNWDVKEAPAEYLMMGVCEVLDTLGETKLYASVYY